MKSILNHYSTISIAQSILAITMKLNNAYPELAKYMSSMSMNIPNKSKGKVSKIVMKEYYEALVVLIASYELEINKKN